MKIKILDSGIFLSIPTAEQVKLVSFFTVWNKDSSFFPSPCPFKKKCQVFVGSDFVDILQ